jgi:hypothetical protein
MARPKLEIDPEEVEKLAMMHCTNVEIASFFGCDEGTIRKRFSDIIAKGKDKGKITLRRYQFQMAKNNCTMAIWLGKQILGQRDQQIENNNELEGRELVLFEKPSESRLKEYERFMQ